jgi:hypothetical protein
VANIDLFLLDGSIAIKGDDVLARTITLGQQVTNSDVVIIDTATTSLTSGGALTLSLGVTASSGSFSGNVTADTITVTGTGTIVAAGNIQMNGGCISPTSSSGADNEAYGNGALGAITTGGGNTSVGRSAGSGITTGSNNITIGKNSGTGIILGTTNVAIGSNTLTAVDATDGMAIGDGAARYTEGSNFVAIGKSALSGSQTTAHTGQFNIAIGANALLVIEGNTWNNTAIGGSSFSSLTTGGGNTGVGKDTGKLITTGSNNIFIGNGTGDTTTTGSSNILIGAGLETAAAGTADQLKIHRNNVEDPILFGAMGAANTNQLGINTTTLNALVTMQTDSAHAMPVLELDQADVDDSFINFKGTSAASAANSISSLTTPGVPAGFTKNEVNGVAQWVQVFDDPSTPELTMGASATTFAVNGLYMEITGNVGNTVATITGGVKGMLLTLKFTDALVTITDTAAATVDTVNLSAAFTSAANTVLQLVHDGNKWFEVSRSVN